MSVRLAGEREGGTGGAGAGPATLLKAENYFRYQLMLRGKQMSRLSRYLAALMQTVKMPEDVTMIIDIDPVDLA